MKNIIKLFCAVIILCSVVSHSGHCSEEKYLDPTHESSAAIALRVVKPKISPITFLDTSFFCYPSHPLCVRIKPTIVCSNGQSLEAENGRIGNWLSFEQKLGIKMSDCPVTLTLNCLASFMPKMNTKKRQRAEAESSKDSTSWKTTATTEIILSRENLFYTDGSPKGIELKLYSSDPDLKFFAIGILRKGEPFSPSPWDMFSQ